MSVSRVCHLSCRHTAIMKIHMVKDLVRLSTRSTHSEHFIDSDCVVSWETPNELNDRNEKTVRKFQIKYSKSLRRVLNKWPETCVFSRGPSQCSIFRVKIYPRERKCWRKKQHGLIRNKHAECEKPGVREKMALSFTYIKLQRMQTSLLWQKTSDCLRTGGQRLREGWPRATGDFWPWWVSSLYWCGKVLTCHVKIYQIIHLK